MNPESLKILVSASDTAFLIHLELRLAPANPEPYLAGEVDVADIQKTVVNIVVDRLLAAHEFIPVGNVNLMYRVSLLHQWRDNPIQSGNFFLID